MKVEVHRAAGVPWNDSAERRLRTAVRRIEGRANRYPEYWSELDVTLTDGSDGVEEVRLSLVLSGHEIVVDRFGEDPAALVDEAFSELFRKFDQYRLETNRTLRQRVERRIQRRSMAPVTGKLSLPKVRASNTRELIEEIYPSLLRIAQHEVAVRQIEGDLEPGLLDPIEALDATLAEVAPELDGDLTEQQATALFQKRLLAWLDNETQELLDHEETDISLDQDLVADGLDFAVSDLGEDIRDFWVMEEDLLYEDIFADTETLDPEAFWSRQEYRSALVQALFTLEHERRRTFSQIVIDGWAVDSVAAAMSLEEREILEMVEESLQALARRLSVGATAWSTARVREVYAALGQQLRDERRLTPA